MQSRFSPKDYILIWFFLVLVGLACRPLMPIDETRAVSVAWEMWQRGDFLVPHLNGLPYSHKPPMLQWCIHLSWYLLGVCEGNARLVAPLFALGNLIMTVKLARQLWPDDKTSAAMAPLILLALPIWALWTTLTLYDMLTAFFALLALSGIIHASRDRPLFGWLLTAVAMGGGILSKGPALFMMILPVALLAPWWIETKPQSGWRAWFFSLTGSVLLAAAIALAWAIPAGFAGGEDYQRMLLWGQTAGRISHSFAHSRPFWWYFAVLPLTCLPWIVWPPLWRSVSGLMLDSGVRFCVVQSLSALVLFSLISAKQIHYLLPMFPALALIAGRALSLSNEPIKRKDQTPLVIITILLALLSLLPPTVGLMLTPREAAEIAGKTPQTIPLFILGIGIAVLAFRPFTPLAGVRSVAWSMFGLMLSAHLVFLQVGWPYFSMQTFADKLAELESQGIPIAHWKKYSGDFNFIGRLPYPLTEIYDKQILLEWIRSNSQGYVVMIRKPDSPMSEDGAYYTQFYRGSRRIMLWKCANLSSRPDIVQQLMD